MQQYEGNINYYSPLHQFSFNSFFLAKHSLIVVGNSRHVLWGPSGAGPYAVYFFIHIILNKGINFQYYADDTQLYIPLKPNEMSKHNCIPPSPVSTCYN